MSEEIILTKDETEKNTIENTVTDNDSSAILNDADASDIVPPTSEPAAPPTAEPQVEVPNLKTPEKAPVPSLAQETAASSSAPITETQPASTASPIRTPKASDDAKNVSPFSEKASDLFGKASEYGEKVSEYTDKASEFAGKTIHKTVSRIKSEDEDGFPEDEVPSKKRFHFKKDDKEFFRDKWILSRISDDQLMDYLTLEQRRNELQQQARDVKERRIFKAFQMTAALAAIVAVIYLLRDNPTILVNILYIAGILTAFWFWKNPRDK